MTDSATRDSGRYAAVTSSFEPYSKLLRSLMPSLRGLAIHDGSANRIWCSEDWQPEDESGLIRRCISHAASDSDEFPAVMDNPNADRAAYAFALPDPDRKLLGIVSLAAAIPSAMGAPRSLQYVRQLSLPALECLRRELTLRQALGSRERDLDGRERDLETLLQIASPKSAPAADGDEFGLVLKTGLERIHCAQAALWVPDKNIELTLARGAEQSVAPNAAMQRIGQHLLAWLRLQQRTIVVNRVATASPAGSQAPPHKIIACPVRHASERVIGVFALFNPPDGEDFDQHQTRIAEMLAKRASGVIESQYDATTGLLTRQVFEERAERLLASASPQESHCILYLDIDRLHVINETFGMHVGDEVIVGVADCVAKSLSAKSLSARISGDRLAMLIPGTNTDGAMRLAETVRKACEALTLRVGHGSIDVTVSIGVAPVNRSDNTLAHALATAEIACKAAKDRGRNRIEIFQDSDQSIVRRHTDVMVIGKLRHALDNDSFRIDAQPILQLNGAGGLPHFELLLRMIGDRGEIIPPAKFLSAAERYQLMPLVDRWVVRHACRKLGEYVREAGRATARFAVNLSGQSLQDDQFLDFVVGEIATNQLPPGMLCFELTETATVGNLRRAQAFIQRLQAQGCEFALDDFGTGVSSLAYLKELSVNFVKIDGSFVRDILENPRSESMIRAIAQLAGAMGLKTIAEYVETDALRVRVAALGVDYGQGFAMGTSQRLEELLAELMAFDSTAATVIAERRDFAA